MCCVDIALEVILVRAYFQLSGSLAIVENIAGGELGFLAGSTSPGSHSCGSPSSTANTRQSICVVGSIA